MLLLLYYTYTIIFIKMQSSNYVKQPNNKYTKINRLNVLELPISKVPRQVGRENFTIII